MGTKDGTGAGAHYNPHGKKHGIPGKSDEHHAGDLGNVKANSEGVITIDIKLSTFQLHGEHSVIGRTLILHERKDDGTGEAGNAGARIGQCVIGIAETKDNKARGQAAAEERKTRQALCELRSDDGRVYGRVAFEQPADRDTPVAVRARICGMAPNSKHGFHIHEYGDLSGESIVAKVGSHFNPQGKKHGLPPSKDRHVGDMGNLVVQEDGVAQFFEANFDLITLHGDHSVIGRAVVVHEEEDDGTGDTGNAGNKIATCVIGIIDDYWEAQATPWDVQCSSAPSVVSAAAGLAFSIAASIVLAMFAML